MRNKDILVGNSNSRNHFEDLGVDGRIILKLMVKKGVEVCGLRALGSAFFQRHAHVNM
jgi:hypothetical protein